MSKSKESKTKCNECLNTFVSQINLKKHIKDVHEKVKDFEREICNQRFARNSSVKNHILVMHKNRDDFPCEYMKGPNKYIFIS